MRGKSGSVDWTMGKLMAIVLAIVFLVILVVGWSGAVKPLYERAGGMLDNVLLFFVNLGDGGGDDETECIEKDIVITGVGEGVATLCRGYREVNLSDSIKWFKADANYFRSDYNGFSFGQDNLLFGFDDKYVIYNRISDFYFERDLFNAYVEANEKYEEDYGSDEFNSLIDERAEFFIYVKIGDDEYRWAEDLKSWEKCASSSSCYFNEWSYIGLWYKKVGSSWEAIPGGSFNYIKDKISGDFSFGIELALGDEDFGLSGGEASFELLEGKRVEAKVLYGKALGKAFVELLEESYPSDGRFDGISIEVVDMFSAENSPELVFEGEYKIGRISNGKDFVLMKSASDGSFSELGYMDSLRLDDEDVEKVVAVNRVRKFLEEEP